MGKISDKYKHLFVEESQLEPSNKLEVPSVTESALRGAAQGATFGFSDEAAAALESSAGSLGLIPDKTYEEALAESQAAYKAAEEANQYSYLAGNVGGGIGATALTGGALGALGIAKKATDIAKAEKAVSKVIPALKMIGLGTAEGALYGAGEAEQGQRLEGATEGAAAGSVIGAALPAAVGVIKGAGKMLGQTSAFKKLKDIYDISKGGTDLLSKEVRDQLEKEAEKSAREVAESLRNTLSNTGELKSEVLSEIPLMADIPRSVVRATLDELAPFTRGKKLGLFPEAQKLKHYSQKFNKFLSSPRLTLEDLDKYRQRLEKQVDKLSEIPGADYDIIQQGNRLVDDIKSISKQISLPESSNNLKSVGDLDKKMAEIYNTAEILTGKKLTELTSESDKLAALQKITKFLSGQEAETQTGKLYRSKINAITNILKESNPDLANKIQKLSDEISRISQASKTVTGVQLPGETSGMNIPIISKVSPPLASFAGTAVHKGKQVTGAMLNIVKEIAPEKLQDIASKYGPKTAETIKEFALANVAKKKTMINVMMQSPETRQALAELFPGYGE